MPTLTRRLALAALGGAGLLGGFYLMDRRRGRARAEALYEEPLSPPEGALRVYHLGHSLVGRDMPAMLQQLAPPGHGYESQLGWGTPLRAHWDPEIPINGFERENDHPRFRAARAAIGSGAYDAIVLTEMVEIRDAIRYHDSARALATWARHAHAANPEARLYLYETWHGIDDPEGWLTRLDRDLEESWKGRILYPALGAGPAPIHLIPAGQVMAAFIRAAEGQGLPDISGPESLFALREDGSQDPIHLNDLGAYLVALVHYAVLYHRSPEGLPRSLTRADGSAARAPSPAAAALMQRITWEVVRAHPETGVAP